MEKKFFKYKGKPLVRCGNTIYYGSMMDDFVTMLHIRDTKSVNGAEVPNNITIQLMRTDMDVAPKDIVVRKSDKVGLAEAMDIADIWLSRAESEHK